MPIFDYECPAGHRFESIRKINEDPKVKVDCPTCSAGASRDEVPRISHSKKNINAEGSTLGIHFKWRPV